MGKLQSKRASSDRPVLSEDQQCILMDGKLSRALQEQITKKKCGFNLANYNVDSSVSELSISLDSSSKHTAIPLKVELPPQKMPSGGSNQTKIHVHSNLTKCCDLAARPTNAAANAKCENCNKLEPFQCEVQVDTSSEKKQDWSFTLYDFDGKGKITKEELANLFQALYDAVGSSIKLPLNGTKTLKLRLSIGQDNSHTEAMHKDNSPPLVKKKAKLKNSNCGVTEWKDIGTNSLNSKEYTRLNNLDTAARNKPSSASKMHNQLSTTTGLGHRLVLSCKEQRKLTEMIHENMVRNHVRQQTGRKHHHSNHRHHRETRRNRSMSSKKHGDENKKPYENGRSYYLDLTGLDSNITHTKLHATVSLPCATAIVGPSTTTTTNIVSAMKDGYTTVINISPSLKTPLTPPPPPPPTTTGSTNYCNEIGTGGDDGEEEVEEGGEIVGDGTGHWPKCDNTWREEQADQSTGGHHRRGVSSSHTKCRNCHKKCHRNTTRSDDLDPQNGHRSKSEGLSRRHKHSCCNNNGNNNSNNNSNHNNSITNSSKEVILSTLHTRLKGDSNNNTNSNCPNPTGGGKCVEHTNSKSSFDCCCSRCQKISCQVRLEHSKSHQIKCKNMFEHHRLRSNASGQETAASYEGKTIATTTTTTTTSAMAATMAAAATAAYSKCDKKYTDCCSKRDCDEGSGNKKQHNNSHQTTPSQEHIAENSNSNNSSNSNNGVVVMATERSNKSPRSRVKSPSPHRPVPTPHHSRLVSLPTTTTTTTTTNVPGGGAGGGDGAGSGVAGVVSTPSPHKNHNHHHHYHHNSSSNNGNHQQLRRHLVDRNKDFNAAMQQVADWINREHAFREQQQQQQQQQQKSRNSTSNTEHFVHVQRHEHHHVHEYHHHHHYHHYYQT